MNSLKDYFHTDWSAMTQHDWVGLIMTIAVFFVMLGLYLYVFHPSNKERFEKQRYIPLDEHMDDELLSSGPSHEHSPKHIPNKKEPEEQK